MNDHNICKKCLLLEAGEKKAYDNITAYIDTVDLAEKVDDTEYLRRLSFCKNCEKLISGMCICCGCYVEVRAVFKKNCCADYDNKKW